MKKYFKNLILLTILSIIVPQQIFAADLLNLKFQVEPRPKEGSTDYCLTNTATATDSGSLARRSSSTAQTQIGNGECTVTGTGVLNINYSFTNVDLTTQQYIKDAFNSVANSSTAQKIFEDAVAANGGLSIKRIDPPDTFAKVVGGCGNAYIDLQQLQIGSVLSAQYIIIHEFGHILRSCNGQLSQAYINSGAFQQEGLVLSYPLTAWGSCLENVKENESFAEMIAVYITYKTYSHYYRPCTNFGPGTYSDYPTRQPVYYNFVKNTIFGGYEY